jgi:pimeloyl-ACP methyl ester carboxylesterase
MSKRSVVESARRYLAANREEERDGFRPLLEAFDGDFDAVVQAVKPVLPPKPQTGWMIERQFTSPRLAGKYPHQPFMLYVPPDYAPSRPRGLALWLHGGGRETGPRLEDLHKDDPAANKAFEQSGRIVCYPSAPPDHTCWSRWQLPEADEYLTDVIEEIGCHYAIDPNDMILAGHSMGGMGAYHMAHRFSDRFTSFLAAAGHWDFACWRALVGTTMWICQPINDAILFRRRHGTDIEFARLARKRLEESGIPCVYREHSGCHSNMAEAIWVLREWLDWSRERRRDPFHPHVVAVSPRGLGPRTDWRRHKVPLAAHENHTDFHSISEAPHTRWVTIEGLGKETLIFDMVTMSPVRDGVEEDWNNFSLTLKRKHVPAGAVEAHLNPDGSIDITPRNVTGFTLWLHPKMVNLEKVCIRVRGVERFQGAVKPSLVTLLDSYLRRRDWGLLYPAKVCIGDDGTWASEDQGTPDSACGRARSPRFPDNVQS